MLPSTSRKKLLFFGISLLCIGLFNILIWLRLLELVWSNLDQALTFEPQGTPWIQYLFLGITSREALLQLRAPRAAMMAINVGLTFSLISCYGLGHLIAGKRYFLSTASIIICMIPVLSPLFFVGLPLGAWSLYELRQEDVRKLFTTGNSYS